MMQVMLFLPRGEEKRYITVTGVLPIKTLSLAALRHYVVYSGTEVVRALLVREKSKARPVLSVCKKEPEILTACCATCTPVENVVNEQTDGNRKKIMKAVMQTNVLSETEVVLTSPKLCSY
jgi:hypothetical protein